MRRTGAAMGVALACGLLAGASCDRSRPARPLPLAADAGGAVAKGPTPDAGVTVAVDPQLCPAAVVGASTRVKDIFDGVQLVIVAKNQHAAQEIRKRAEKLAAPPAVGGGATAGCAIHYVPGAETTIQDVRGGVSVTITASTPEAVAGLRKAARERAALMARAGTEHRKSS